MRIQITSRATSRVARQTLRPLSHMCVALLTSFALVGLSGTAHAAPPLGAVTAPVAVTEAGHQHVSRDFTIKAQDVQILFVDLQPELTKGSRSNPPQALAANAAVLAKVARIVNVPVTFSIVPWEGKPGRHIPELGQYASMENTFPRVMAGTFMEAPLVAKLAASKRKILVVAGFTTEVAVLQTALGALAAGYTVYIPVDAIGSQSSRSESAALRQMELAGAIPTSVLALAAQLAPDFSQAPGSDVLATFRELSPIN